MIYLPTLFGFLFFLYFAYRIFLNKEYVKNNSNWKETTATIKDSRYLLVESTKNNKIKSYTPYFFATYCVDEVDYGTNTISEINVTNRKIRLALNSIEGKKDCSIFYNPKFPHKSSLLNPKDVSFNDLYIKAGLIFSITIISLFFAL